MAEHGPAIGRQATTSGWWFGVVVFAGVMMIVLGIFHALTGLTAILKDEFFVSTPNNYLISVDVTSWGWIHLIGGAVVAVAGCFVRVLRRRVGPSDRHRPGRAERALAVHGAAEIIRCRRKPGE
jgi:hypothetical protein